MKLSVVRDEELSKEFHVQISKADFDKKFEAVIQKESANIIIDGFRKGKAPLELVKRQQGHKFERQVRVELLEESLDDIAKKHKIDKKDVDVRFNPEKDNVLDFNVTYDTVSDFKLKELKDLKLNNYYVDVESKKLQDQVLNRILLTERVEFDKEVKDKPVGKDHFVVIHIDVYHDDKLKMEAFSNRKLDVYMGDESFLGKDFIKQLEGMKLNEEKTFEITFPKTQPSKFLAGKKHKVSIKVVKIYTLGKLNESGLLKKLQEKNPDLKDLDQLKLQLTQEFGGQLVTDYLDIIHRRRTLDAIDDTYDFGMSARLVENAIQDIKKSFEEEQKKAKENGIILQEDIIRTPKENEAEFERLAKRRIKAHEIFMKMRDAYAKDLQVTEMDMRKALIEYAQNYGVPFEQAVEFLKKNENFAKRIMSRIFETKALDLCHKNATLTQKPIADIIEVFALYDEIMPGILVGV
ncbi:MAG: hypothetical protein H6850_01340 [Alphaproteobacteria bacterium]|nr:MAG: hypothetical protein H6850_01340 [Alphaproteobacteria bacterium]